LQCKPRSENLSHAHFQQERQYFYLTLGQYFLSDSSAHICFADFQNPAPIFSPIKGNALEQNIPQRAQSFLGKIFMWPEKAQVGAAIKKRR
jgi:hypothetical protein